MFTSTRLRKYVSRGRRKGIKAVAVVRVVLEFIFWRRVGGRFSSEAGLVEPIGIVLKAGPCCSQSTPKENALNGIELDDKCDAFLPGNECIVSVLFKALGDEDKGEDKGVQGMLVVLIAPLLIDIVAGVAVRFLLSLSMQIG